MSFIDTIKAKAAADLKTIVLPESEDDRTILAAAKNIADKTAKPVIIGNKEEILASAERLGVSLEGAGFVDNTSSEDIDRYATLLAELRAKKGMTFEQAKEILTTDRLYFGIMMAVSREQAERKGLETESVNESWDEVPDIQIEE